jgi:hypothetical protein
MVESFQNCLQPFVRASLEESKAMSFLNRFDTKFVLKTNNAFDFLKDIQNNYSLLQINDEIIQSYRTVYFDTRNLHCFNLHHNKRANRFKFRTRHYLSNGKIFNEIKQKLNTGKTVKFRQRRDVEKNGISILKEFSKFDDAFMSLASNNGYKFEVLAPSLFVFFNRITLLNRLFPERVTLDFGLRYEFGKTKVLLKDTAIVELKRDRSPERSAAQNSFRKIHKEPSAFSKYCMGICLTCEDVRKNRFLSRLRNLSFERSNLL